MSEMPLVFAWHDGTAEDAAQLYLGLVPNSSITSVSRAQPGGPALVVEVSLDGFPLALLNAGPMFRPNPSISLFMTRRSESEVRTIFAGLKEGGKILMDLDTYPWSPLYGWVEDRYGMSWQVGVVPEGASPSTAPALLFGGPLAGKAEEAQTLYASLLTGGKLGFVARSEENTGLVLYSEMELPGGKIIAMDSPYPHDFAFTEGMSLLVKAEDQAETDRLWDGFIADGGQASRCGWLKDKYGVSWQIVPKGFLELMFGVPERVPRMMEVMMAMDKLDINVLRQAAETA